jgi:hypothetical protein
MNEKRKKWLALLIIAVGVAAGVLLISAAISMYIVAVKAPTDLAQGLAANVKTWFNFTPRVKVGELVVVEQETPILELATVSRGVFVEYSWQHMWLGSTKTLQLTGAFTVKSGYDLHDAFELRVDKDPLRVTATLPPPRILSVQMDTLLVMRDESGWWNKITSLDRQNAVNALRVKAREKAEAAGILDSTVTTTEAQIRKIVEWNGSTVTFLPGAQRP